MKQARNSHLDNIKALLIFFVVLGHFIEPLVTESDLIKYVYMAIYSFHMPLFIFISGRLLKINNDKGNIRGNLVLMLIFQALFFGMSLFIDVNTPMNLYWIMWFMCALLGWNIVVPKIVKFVKRPLLVSLLLALLIVPFNYSRFIVFMPFFILGYIYDEKWKDYIVKFKYHIGFLSLVCLGVLALVYKGLDYRIFYGSLGFIELNYTLFEGIIYRVGTLFMSFILSLTIFLFMPERHHKHYSKVGKNTMFVYFGHGFLTKILVAVGFISVSNWHLLLILAFVTTYVFSFNCFNHFLKKSTKKIVYLSNFRRLKYE